MGIYIKDFKMPEGGYRTIEIAYDADGHPMALADGGDVFDVIPVQPVVRGTWIWNDNGEVVCSECNDLIGIVGNIEDLETVISGFNFCPNCGAWMEANDV